MRHSGIHLERQTSAKNICDIGAHRQVAQLRGASVRRLARMSPEGRRTTAGPPTGHETESMGPSTRRVGRMPLNIAELGGDGPLARRFTHRYSSSHHDVGARRFGVGRLPDQSVRESVSRHRHLHLRVSPFEDLLEILLHVVGDLLLVKKLDDDVAGQLGLGDVSPHGGDLEVPLHLGSDARRNPLTALHVCVFPSVTHNNFPTGKSPQMVSVTILDRYEMVRGTFMVFRCNSWNDDE